MYKNWKKGFAVFLSCMMVIANIMLLLPKEIPQAAEVGEATDIEYNTDSRILTQNGLGKLQKFKQSMAGVKWIPLPSKTVMVQDEVIYQVGSDSKSGLDKYMGKVGSLIPMQDNANVTELKNLIFNLPPFRSAKSVQASAGVTSSIRNTADYVKMYLTANGMETATTDEKAVISKMAATPVDETKLKVTVGEFDTSNPAKISGEYAYYGPISFEVNKRAMEGSVSLLNITDNGMVSVVDSKITELDKGKIDLSQTYYLKVLNSQKIKNVTITFNIQTPVEKLAFFTNHLTDTTAGYCIVPYVELQEESASVDVGSFGKLGTIRIRCTDVDTGEPIKGASFIVETAKDGAHRTNVITNEKGYASCASMPVGEYRVYQQSTIAGYEKSTTDKFPMISADGITIDIAYTNKQFDSYAQFTICDENSMALNGGSIGIYDEEDRLIASGVVDSNGSYSVRLKAGRYVAKQLTAKEGYLVDTKAYSFQIQNNTDVIKHKFTNSKVKGSVNVTFYDPSNENLTLDNGYFAITDKEGKTLSGPYKMTAGSYTVTGLNPGTYYVKQTTPPTGYQINNNLYIFTITSNSQVDTVNIPNIKKKGAISLTALDEDGKFLKGVTFICRDEKGNQVGEGITNANGQVVFSNLPTGTYQCMATKVPAGYVLNNSTTKKVIAEEGQTAAGQHTYQYVRGTVQIRKVDSSTLAGVEGAILSIRNPDNIEIKRVTTDQDGMAEVELKYGSYLVWEIDPGDSYTPIGKQQQFAIETNGETVQVLIDSAKIISDVILRVHRSTAVYDMIAGAKFTLYKEDHTIVKGYENVTTGADGQIKIKSLPYGSYYLKQTATSFDCILYKETIPVIVSKNGEVIEVEVINAVKTGSITLLYRDKDTKEPIFGAEFTLFDADTKRIVDAQYTNKSGIVYFTKVPYGKYYIRMTVAAPGYELNDEMIGLSEEEPSQKREARNLSLFSKLTAYAASESIKKRYITVDDNSPNVVIGGADHTDNENGQIGNSDATVSGGGNTENNTGGNSNSNHGNKDEETSNSGGNGSQDNNNNQVEDGKNDTVNGEENNQGGEKEETNNGNQNGTANTDKEQDNSGDESNIGGNQKPDTGENQKPDPKPDKDTNGNGTAQKDPIIIEGNKKPSSPSPSPSPSPIPSVDVPIPPNQSEQIPNVPISTPSTPSSSNQTTSNGTPNLNEALINEELEEDVILSEEQPIDDTEGEEIDLSELETKRKKEEEIELSKEHKTSKEEKEELKEETKRSKRTSSKQTDRIEKKSQTSLPKTGTNELEQKQVVVYLGTILSFLYTIWEFKPWKKFQKK